MDLHFTITEEGIPHSIPVNGPTVFATSDGKAVIQYLSSSTAQFHPIYTDQTFMEVVKRREYARAHWLKAYGRLN